MSVIKPLLFRNYLRACSAKTNDIKNNRLADFFCLKIYPDPSQVNEKSGPRTNIFSEKFKSTPTKDLK